MAGYFLSCDWGTTAFRLCLVDTSMGLVIAQESSKQGISATYNSWLADGENEHTRAAFYLRTIEGHIKCIKQKTGIDLGGVKLIISGMASSSIGIMDIPYATGPLAVDGCGFETVLISGSDAFDHDVLIISGVHIGDDIMRGEETQLIGCLDVSFANEQTGIYIFPGTHSKHITVTGNNIAGITTYMTGEIFELLSQKSILKNSVEQFTETNDLTSFKKGVSDSLKANLLSAAFKTRTNHLFNIYNKTENFQYLSGLLIGTELKDLLPVNAEVINLVCGTSLQMYYKTALQELALSKTTNTFPAEWVDEATIRGQLQIGRQLNFLP